MFIHITSTIISQDPLPIPPYPNVGAAAAARMTKCYSKKTCDALSENQIPNNLKSSALNAPHTSPVRLYAVGARAAIAVVHDVRVATVILGRRPVVVRVIVLRKIITV